MAKTYRAAYYKHTVLTGPAHASLTDAELRAEALAEALRADIVDIDETDMEAAYPRITIQALEDGLRIGDWTE